MPRVDLRYRYTRFPHKPSPAFPDQTEVWQPVIPVAIGVQGKGLRVVALLDTGASNTFIGAQLAEALGLDWQAAPTVPITGIGGTGLVGHGVDMTLALPAAKYAWTARIVVSPAIDGFPYPLLGHSGFFEHFEVRFKSRQQSFRVLLK